MSMLREFFEIVAIVGLLVWHIKDWRDSRRYHGH